jgi:hypothetical protein
MNDTDANPGVETSYERARLLIALSWVAKVAGLALVAFYFWVGVLFFAVSWGLDAAVYPPRPAPDPRDRRLKWAMLGFGALFVCGWIAHLVKSGAGAMNPALVSGLIGLVVCEFSRYLRADVEYLRARREADMELDEVSVSEPASETHPPDASVAPPPQQSSAPGAVQGELPL